MFMHLYDLLMFGAHLAAILMLGTISITALFIALSCGD